MSQPNNPNNKTYVGTIALILWKPCQRISTPTQLNLNSISTKLPLNLISTLFQPQAQINLNSTSTITSTQYGCDIKATQSCFCPILLEFIYDITNRYLQKTYFNFKPELQLLFVLSYCRALRTISMPVMSQSSPEESSNIYLNSILGIQYYKPPASKTPVGFVLPVVFLPLEILSLALKLVLKPQSLPALYQTKPANAGY